MKLTYAGKFWLGYVLVLGLLPLSCTHAHAAQIEVGAGIAQSDTHGDGTWYQDAFQHQLDLRSPAFMVGLTGAFSEHFAWHLDAVSLGRYSVDSWDTPSDADYSAYEHGSGHHLPLVHILGSGSVYGVAATLEAHTQHFGVEAGPFLYHASWNLSVPNWQAQTGSPGNVEWNSHDGALYSEQSHWAIGGVVGVSLHSGAWTLSLRRYFDGKGFAGHGADPWPPLWKSQTVAMVTYTF